MTVLMPDKVVVRGPDRFVKGDNRTQMVWFTVPRYRDGVDLSGLGWLIHIRNAAGVETTAQPVDGTPEVRTDKIMIGWLVLGTATAAVGDLTFSLRGAGADKNGNPMRWCSGDEVRPVCDAQESFSSSDSEAPVTVLEQLVQLVQVELPEVRDAAEAAADRANAAAAEASEQAGIAAIAANNANTAATRASEQADRASEQADRADIAATAAERSASEADTAAAYADEKGRDAADAAADANAATVRLEEGLSNAEDALKRAKELEYDVTASEAQRVKAENARKTAETTRAADEVVRKQNESFRKNDEASRALAESNRVTAENARESSEEKRSNEWNELREEVDSAIAAANRVQEVAIEVEMLAPSADATASVTQTEKKTMFSLGIPMSNLAYATFEVDESMNLLMHKPDNYGNIDFALDNGELEVRII